MRRVTQLITFLLLGLVTIVGFQNCAGYEAANNPLYDSSEAVCIGLSCGQNAEMIGVTIAAEGMLYVRRPQSQPMSCDEVPGDAPYNLDSLCFDVSGYCEDGGFPNNEIWAELKGGTTQQFPTAPIAKCVDGRYRFRYQLPPNYDYQNLHSLRVTIRSIDANGNIVENPSGANWQEVGLSSYTQL